MATNKSFLDQLSIPSPCPERWSDLVGDDRRRYCERCAKHVYDFSKLTTTEVLALLTTLQGDVCARMTRQPDGTVLTEKPLIRLPIARPRVSPLASVAVTAMISITASPAGRPPAQAGRVLQPNFSSETRTPNLAQRIGEATASISGTVLDQMGAVIAGAKVSLINESSGETRIVLASEEGKFQFTGLSEGEFTLRVESTGFATSVMQAVKLASSQQQRVDVTMEVGREVVSVGGVIAIVPKPLRVLYNESDLIVVARIGESKIVERERDAHLVRSALQVTSVLKGDKRGRVDLYHWNYGDLENAFRPGEEMLLFLKPSTPRPGVKARRGYELDDTQYGAKKIAGTELRAYLERIAELSQIIPPQGPTDAALVEWLVRCAEDPATRWEGAFELAASIQRYSDHEADEVTEADDEKKMQSDAPPSSVKATSDKEASVIEAQAPDAEDSEREPDFAAVLAGEQKARLMTALFQTEKLLEGDFQLIELAKHWKEPRLLPFLINQLRKLESEAPRSAERLMECIADVVDDKVISDRAQEYRDNVSYPEEDHEKNFAEAASATAEQTQEVREAIKSRSEMIGKFLRAVEAMTRERAR